MRWCKCDMYSAFKQIEDKLIFLRKLFSFKNYSLNLTQILYTVSPSYRATFGRVLTLLLSLDLDINVSKLGPRKLTAFIKSSALSSKMIENGLYSLCLQSILSSNDCPWQWYGGMHIVLLVCAQTRVTTSNSYFIEKKLNNQKMEPSSLLRGINFVGTAS